MAEERFEEKTQPATPRRRQEARERGHVARSTDLSAAVLLLAALLTLHATAPEIAGAVWWLADQILGNLATIDVDAGNVHRHFLMGGLLILRVLAPLGLTVIVVGIAVNVMQVGFQITTQPLEPDLSKLNPIQGMQKFVSARGLMRLGTGILKILVIGGVLGWTFWGERFRVMDLMDQDVDEIVKYLVEMIYTGALRAVLALLVLAILDFAWEKWKYERDLRMSREEVKEELKRLEGDPKIKRRRFATHQKIVLQRMMQEVPKATVVITNPTEYAVAIRYDEGMPAPQVVAKGVEHLARRIREIAAEHGVPIHREPPLAQALYKSVEVNQYIPEELYQAVAEVLALVYRIHGRRKAA